LAYVIWPNEAVAANVSDGADASNFAWADMADANESNDGNFDFCRTTTSSHLQFTSIVRILSKPLLK